MSESDFLTVLNMIKAQLQHGNVDTAIFYCDKYRSQIQRSQDELGSLLRGGLASLEPSAQCERVLG